MAPLYRPGFANKTYKARKFFAIVLLLIFLGLGGFGIATFIMATIANQKSDFDKPAEATIVWLYPLISGIAWLLAAPLVAVLMWKKSKTV